MSKPTEDPATDLQKKIRNITKKVRQCEELQMKKQAGTELTQEQEEKLSKLSALQSEVAQLQSQCS